MWHDLYRISGKFGAQCSCLGKWPSCILETQEVQIFKARWQANFLELFFFFFQKSIPFLSREASLSDSINFPFPHMFPSHRVTWIWISEWKETGLLRDGQWPSESEGSRALLLCLEVGTTELAWSTQRCCSHRAEEAPGSHQALSRAQGPLGFLSLLIHDGNHYFHVPIVLSAIHTFSLFSKKMNMWL